MDEPVDRTGLVVTTEDPGPQGVIVEVLPGGKLLVRLDTGATVEAHLAGKLRRFRIHVTEGDRVTVRMSPYDTSRARVVFRHG